MRPTIPSDRTLAEDRETVQGRDAGALASRSPRRRLAAQHRRGAGAASDKLGLPLIIRPSFTLGWHGREHRLRPWTSSQYAACHGPRVPVSDRRDLDRRILIAGWKEFELEVMRDRNDNVRHHLLDRKFDPMGVHTGDSITVAPAQTPDGQRVSDHARRLASRCIRAIGVETGGSNVQFAINPADGRHGRSSR